MSRTCHFARAACFIAAAALVAGCDSPRQRAEKRLEKIDRTQLRKEAALLYKNLFASQGPSFSILKPDHWPRTFRQVAPRHVGIYRDGFSLALDQKTGNEAGIYVVPLGMELEPASRGPAHFDEIGPGIYWYTFEP